MDARFLRHAPGAEQSASWPRRSRRRASRRRSTWAATAPSPRWPRASSRGPAPASVRARHAADRHRQRSGQELRPRRSDVEALARNVRRHRRRPRDAPRRRPAASRATTPARSSPRTGSSTRPAGASPRASSSLRNEDRAAIGAIPLVRDSVATSSSTPARSCAPSSSRTSTTTSSTSRVTADGEPNAGRGLTDLIVKGTRIYGGAWIFDDRRGARRRTLRGGARSPGKRDWISKAILHLDGLPLSPEALAKIGVALGRRERHEDRAALSQQGDPHRGADRRRGVSFHAARTHRRGGARAHADRAIATLRTGLRRP